MAKQRGVFKAEGLLDEFSFYESLDGFMVRKKGGVKGERIATDPAFERTRENQQEFGRAGRAGKMLRNALRPILLLSKDRLLVARMLKAMMKVVKADTVNERGMRTVTDGNLDLLQGFEFNENGKLSQTLFAPFVASIDRASGDLSIQVLPFVPSNMISAPGEATHFKIVGAGGSIDFETGINSLASESSEDLALGNDPTAILDLSFKVEANSALPLFLALGISFTQQVNGKQYPLKTGNFNALCIVKVSAK
jgi:hypothetical protein